MSSSRSEKPRNTRAERGHVFLVKRIECRPTLFGAYFLPPAFPVEYVSHRPRRNRDPDMFEARHDEGMAASFSQNKYSWTKGQIPSTKELQQYYSIALEIPMCFVQYLVQ